MKYINESLLLEQIGTAEAVVVVHSSSRKKCKLKAWPSTIRTERATYRVLLDMARSVKA